MSDRLDCLIIQAPNDPPSERSILIEPVDVLTLATYVRHAGYTVAFHDLDRFGVAALEDETRRFRVAVVVLDYYIPLHTSAAFQLLGDVFTLLERVSDVRLVAGRLSSYDPDLFLNTFQPLDGCIIGEAEEALILEVLTGATHAPVRSKDGNLITRANASSLRVPRRTRHPANLYMKFPESGPIADRSLCEFHSYIDVHSIISSRGCTGACRFCSTVQFWGTWRGASPELVVNEFGHVVRSGARKVIFLDDNFADDPERALRIALGLQRAGFGIPWGCLCRIEDMSSRLAAEMATAGCRWIHFGIEHGTEQVRLSIGKRYTNQQAIQVVEMVKSLGLRVRTSWILDLPTATAASVDATFELARRLGSHEVKLHYLAIRPGSTYFHDLRRGDAEDLGDMFIHTAKPNCQVDGPVASLPRAVETFRLQMETDGYQWVDDVKYWRRYTHCEASPDDRFLSTVVTRYGLGW